MKRILLLALTALVMSPLFSHAQSKLVLTGSIRGLPNGTVVAITDANNPVDTIARSVVANQAFRIQATLKEPMILHVLLGRTYRGMAFLGNEKVMVTGDTAHIADLKFTGSQTASDFQAFQKTFNPLFGTLSKHAELSQQGMGSDSLNTAAEAARAGIEKGIDEFINKRRGSPVSGFLLAVTMQLSNDPLKIEQRYLKLKPSALNTMYGTYVKEAVADSKINAIGSKALDFTQPDTAGVNVSLASFQGKYVLVDFWASWCGPCRAENPNVVENFNRFKDKNFTVLGVSLDRPGQKARWLEAIHKDGLTWTHVSDLKFWENEVAKKYKIQSIPQNFLLDPAGKIIAKNLRGPDLSARLCQLLGCDDTTQPRKAF